MYIDDRLRGRQRISGYRDSVAFVGPCFNFQAGGGVFFFEKLETSEGCGVQQRATAAAAQKRSTRVSEDIQAAENHFSRW